MAALEDGRTVQVEVTDGSATLPTPRPHAPLSATGRGLRIVEQLAERWGVRPAASGKTVWFQLCASAPGDTAREAD